MFSQEEIISKSQPDKNGTITMKKKIPCYRCSGSGQYKFMSMGKITYGTCFKCDGDGFLVVTEKSFTPEYRAKLNALNKKRADRKIRITREKESQKNFDRYGFEKGYIYVVIEENSYAIKDELHHQGATYDPLLGWFFKEKQEQYKTQKVFVEEFSVINDEGIIELKLEEYSERQQEILRAKRREEGEFIGTIAQRLELDLKLTNTVTIDTQWGNVYLHLFEDKNHNSLIWKTNKFLYYDEWDVGEVRKVKATIKAHDYYRDTKQTWVKNVKIQKNESEGIKV
ncbi:TPA: hypothetical protein ACGU7O_001133 [Enterococcus faecium]|nr:hypothetical protein [Enterococcus faecium]HAQ0816560.1 hypothetical protein [Enterococcus faecium]HAQ0900106.1 hypothetical protein [Enterococcus faecium]HAQ0978281.1 hypothetical protein [Enterococcus faecium]HAQ0994948.1 hypothetical protein [Enterococcus faecium]